MPRLEQHSRVWRRHLLEVSKVITGAVLNGEQAFAASDGSYWDIYDSCLNESTPQEDSAQSISFDKYFKPVLPDGVNLGQYIEGVLGQKPNGGVGIEVGGPGSNLFAGFKLGLFKATAGITLGDQRTADKKIRDIERNHKVITGNLLDEGCKQRVRKWRGDQQIDVVFERMVAGLACLPMNSTILFEEVNYWFQTLSPNGVMFIQVPNLIHPLLEPWKQKVESETDRKVGITFTGNGSEAASYNLLRINRVPGAPNSLPFLNLRERKQLGLL